MLGLSRRSLAVVATTFAAAAILGVSAGVVGARQSGETEFLAAGQNLVAGPRDQPTSAAEFLFCLPSSAIDAVYTYQPGNASIGLQPRWRHFFKQASVPAWVNLPANGGIPILTSQNAVYIIANTDIPNARFKEHPGDDCS